MAGATNITGGNQFGDGQDVSDHDDNHDHYHTEEVKHSNNVLPEFPVAKSRLEQPLNRR